MKGDVGSIGQNRVRPDVAQQMVDEMLCCNIDEFLRHYAPFVPSKRSVSNALKNLEKGNLLQDGGWWNLSGNKIPSRTQEIETDVFSKLTPIVEALMKQQCSGTDSKTLRKCNFSYRDCGNTPMVGEIAGCTFRIDACFSPVSSDPLPGKVVASQVAVAAEFKKNREDVHDVSARILNAVSLI